MVSRAAKAASDLSLSSYSSVDLRTVRIRPGNDASILVYRNPFNGQRFAHDENYAVHHGRPGRARSIERNFGKSRITVEFSDGTKVTALPDAFVTFSADLLPAITAAHEATTKAFAQAKNPLQGLGRWIALMAEYVSPTPRQAPALVTEADLPF